MNKKVVIILTIITSVLTLISVAFRFGIPTFLLHRPRTIGIIGGADGPTSIYVTGSSSVEIITIVLALLSVAGILYMILSRKSQK